MQNNLTFSEILVSIKIFVVGSVFALSKSSMIKRYLLLLLWALVNVNNKENVIVI